VETSKAGKRTNPKRAKAPKEITVLVPEIIPKRL
jgi:hypothetical protein